MQVGVALVLLFLGSLAWDTFDTLGMPWYYKLSLLIILVVMAHPWFRETDKPIHEHEGGYLES